MYCPFCGEQIADDSKFCGACGKPIDPEKESSVIAVVEPDYSRSYVEPPLKPKRKAPVAIIAIIIAVIVFCAGTVAIIKSGLLSSNKGNLNYCAWLSNGEYQFVKNMTKQNAKTIAIGSSEGSKSENNSYFYVNNNYGHLTNDGKYLYYFSRIDEDNGTGTLYRAELAKLKPNHKNNEKHIEKIDSDACLDGFYVREDGSVVYKKPDNNYNDNYTYRICYYNGNEVKSIASDVNTIYYTNEAIVFNKPQDNDDGYTLYARLIDSKDDAVKIDKDTDYSFVAKDHEHIIYYKHHNDDEDDSYAMYIAGYSTESKKIADYVYEDTASRDYRSISSFCYVTRKGAEKSLADYVENPYSTEDENAVEPDSDAPEYTEEYETWWGTTTQNNDAFYAAMEEYEQAQSRLELMDHFYEVPFTEYTYSMYYYDPSSNESQLISDQIDNNSASYSTSGSGNTLVSLYFKRKDNFSKISIDEIMSNENYDTYNLSQCDSVVTDYIYANSTDQSTLFFTVAGGKEQSVEKEKFGFSDHIQYYSIVSFDSGKRLAIHGTGYDQSIEHSVYSGIYIASISKKAVGSFSAIETTGEVHDIACANNQLCYSRYSDDSDNVAAYLYRDSKFIELLDGNSSVSDVEWYTDGTILFLSDYDSNYGGTLVKVDSKGKKEKIADDVTSFCALDNGNILHTSNGNLRIYDGKNSTTIADDVDGYWCVKKKETVTDTGDTDYYDD